MPIEIISRMWEREDGSWEPAVGRCDCGEEVTLQVDFEGLCYCHCGATYNGAGQRIRPRSQWEERHDWDDY